MAIRATCSACSASYNLSDEMAGKKVRCKACGGVIVVAGAGARPAAVSAGPKKDEYDLKDDVAPRVSAPRASAPSESVPSASASSAGASAPPRSMYLTNPVKEDRVAPSMLPKKLIAWGIIIGVPLLLVLGYWGWSKFHEMQMAKRPGIAVVVHAEKTFSSNHTEPLVRDEMIAALEEKGWGVRDDASYKAEAWVTMAGKVQFSNKAKNSFLTVEIARCQIRFSHEGKEISMVTFGAGPDGQIEDRLFNTEGELSGYRNMMKKFRSGEVAIPSPPAK